MGKGLSEQERVILDACRKAAKNPDVEDRIVLLSHLHYLLQPHFDYEESFRRNGGTDDWADWSEIYRKMLNRNPIWQCVVAQDDPNASALGKMHLESVAFHKSLPMASIQASVARSVTRLEKRGLVRRLPRVAVNNDGRDLNGVIDAREYAAMRGELCERA